MAMAVEPVDQPGVPEAGREETAELARRRSRGRSAAASATASPALPPRPRSSPSCRCRRWCSGSPGTIGYIARQFEVAQVDVLKNRVIDLASQALTPDTVEKVITPTHERRAPRRPPRRHLDRLRPGAVVRLAGAQRLHRHDLDHVRARRTPRHRQDPRAVVHALRRRAAHRHRAGAARAGRTGRGRRDHPGPRGVPPAGATGRRSWCSRSAS